MDIAIKREIKLKDTVWRKDYKNEEDYTRAIRKKEQSLREKFPKGKVILQKIPEGIIFEVIGEYLGSERMFFKDYKNEKLFLEAKKKKIANINNKQKKRCRVYEKPISGGIELMIYRRFSL